MSRTVVTAGLAALLCAGLALQGCGAKGPPENYRLAGPSRGPFESVVRLDGDLEAKEQYELSAPLSAVVTYVVVEGSQVHKGEVVARLDASSAERELVTAASERDQKRLDLQLQQLELDGEVFELSNRLAFGELDLQVLKITERILRTGVDAAEVVRATLSARNAAAQVSNLQASLKEKTPFAAKGFVSKDEMEDQKLKLIQQSLERKIQGLGRELLMKGAGPARVADAQRDIALSESALKLIQQKLMTFQHRRKALEDDLGARIAVLEKDVALSKSVISQAVVTSPTDGIVIYKPFNVNGPDEVKVRQGTSVERGVAFAKVASLGGVEVQMQVPERDALRVRPGMPARIRPSTLPSKVFAGTVKEVRRVISSTGFGRWLHPQVYTLRVDADVTGTDPALAPGATALVELVTASRPNVLTLDSAALARPGQVQLADGTWRAVRTGESGYERTEILEGLKEGEQVRVPALLMQPPTGAPTVQVRRGDLELKVEDTGALEALLVRDVFLSDLEVDTKIGWLAQEGTAVSSGEVVARIEDQPFRDKLLEKSLEHDTAHKESLAAQEKTSSEVSTLAQQLVVAGQDLRIAEIDLQLLREGKTPRERADLKAELDLAAKGLEAAQRQLTLKEELARRGFASQSELKDLAAKVGEARAGYEVARVKVELAEQGATELDLRKAEVLVEKARLTQALAKRKLAAGERKRALTLERARLVLDAARAEQTRFQAMVESATVKAPTSGTVVLAERWSNDGLGKTRPGDNVDDGVPFLKIANLSKFEVAGTVPESKVRFVKAGQKAVFWLSSNTGELFPATVERVAPFATTRDSNRFSFLKRSEKVFDVRLSTTAVSRKFQPGVSTSFRAITERLTGVVLVPASAVLTDWQGTFVFDASGQRRPIDGGLNTDTDLCVNSGLEAGEWILGPASDAN